MEFSENRQPIPDAGFHSFVVRFHSANRFEEILGRRGTVVGIGPNAPHDGGCQLFVEGGAEIVNIAGGLRVVDQSGLSGRLDDGPW